MPNRILEMIANKIFKNIIIKFQKIYWKTYAKIY